MVEIVEVGPRDGLQNEQTVLAAADKVEFVRQAAASGIRRVEVTSFVNPKRVPQMADAEEVVAAARDEIGDSASFIGLVLNRMGLDRALAAGVDEVNAVIVASDTFSRRNQGMSVDAALAAWADIAESAHAAGVRASVTVGAAFGCPFEGEVPHERVLSLVRRAAEAAPDEIALADTIGVGVPTQVRTLLGGAASIAPDVPLRCHFHNTRNTGYANAIAACEAGVSALDASAGGIGGCPFAPSATGNIATEDLLYLLHRSGVGTGVSLPGAVATAAWLGRRLGAPVPAMLGRAGPFPPEGG
ncbi:MAG: hydroxymethylglutaryl-CoA lyase [Carbonactinosporaceae bacterium]